MGWYFVGNRGYTGLMTEWVVAGLVLVATLVSLGVVVSVVVRVVAASVVKSQESAALISAKVVEETIKAVFGGGESGAVQQLPGAPENTDPSVGEPPFFPDVEFDPNMPGAMESIADGAAQWMEVKGTTDDA